jgi:hypothetical protein
LGPHTIPATTAFDGVPSGIKISNIRKTEHGSVLFDVKFLSEPGYKIVNIEYQSDSAQIQFHNNNRTQQYTEINASASDLVKIKITTENVENGANVSIYYPEFDLTIDSSPISNNECIINLESWQNSALFTGSRTEMRIFSFKLLGDTYADAFVYNDCVLVST